MLDPKSNTEVNARSAARGVYYRWLLQQHGSIPMLELQEDNQDPISLRKIFIPLRLDIEDRDESTINPPAKFHDENKENQLGHDAFDEIVEHDFLVISGRPGAGKTTLIKALINELCGTYSSNFRSTMQEQYGAVFTIPVILRELPEIESVNSLDDLLSQWWARLDELNQLAFERKTFNERFDLASLKASLKYDELQPLILLDGIDEVGSFEVRSKIYQIAQDAKKQGYRTLLTGRPSGLADLHSAVKNGMLSSGRKDELKRIIDDVSTSEGLELKNTSSIFDSEDDNELQAVFEYLSIGQENVTVSSMSTSKEQWRFIQPLTRPQIDLFIKKWYQLDPTWVSKLGTHPKEFKAALADPQRSHLLPLARRPIFLSLMAIVHCTKNEMPHGRAELYKTIVDVYLTRQRKHRRLKQTTKGESMPQWDSHEPRTALGYLAWRSMHKGSGKEGEGDRQILWKREDMEATLQEALTSTLRFSEVTKEDASSLINYYLNPAGLLIEPVEGYIQFAHLSFQEYLCAEYLQGKMSGRRMEAQWRKEVLEHLESPGWQEVALLLLTVHANKTQNRGHFELISYLDVANYQQAQLMFCALLGKELPIQSDDRRQWLKILVMAALVHPKMSEITYFNHWSDLSEDGLIYIRSMFDAFDQAGGEGVWQYLSDLKCSDSLSGWMDEYFDDIDEYFAPISNRWLNPSGDKSWSVEKDAQEAQLSSLLKLLFQSRWGGFDPEDQEQPLKNPDLQITLSKLYEKSSSWIKEDQQWKILDSHCLFERFFNRGDVLETLIWQSMPLGIWLLSGESHITPSVASAIESEVLVIEQRTRLSLAFFQWQQLLEVFPFGKSTKAYSEAVTKAVLRLQLSSQYSGFRRLLLRPKSQFRLHSRSIAQLQTTVIALLSNKKVKLHIGGLSEAISEIVSASYKSIPWYEKNAVAFKRLAEIQDIDASDAEQLVLLGTIIESVGYNFSAREWFIEQSETPQLLVSRGGREGEPLPSELGLFSEKGLPCLIQQRENLLRLKEWAENDDNWFNFVFPDEDVSVETRQLLLDDIAELKQCDFSPYRLMDAVLADWPKGESTQDCSMETSEKLITQILEGLLAKYPEVEM